MFSVSSSALIPTSGRVDFFLVRKVVKLPTSYPPLWQPSINKKGILIQEGSASQGGSEWIRRSSPRKLSLCPLKSQIAPDVVCELNGNLQAWRCSAYKEQLLMKETQDGSCYRTITTRPFEFFWFWDSATPRNTHSDWNGNLFLLLQQNNGFQQYFPITSKKPRKHNNKRGAWDTNRNPRLRLNRAKEFDSRIRWSDTPVRKETVGLQQMKSYEILWWCRRRRLTLFKDQPREWCNWKAVTWANATQILKPIVFQRDWS